MKYFIRVEDSILGAFAKYDETKFAPNLDENGVELPEFTTFSDYIVLDFVPDNTIYTDYDFDFVNKTYTKKPQAEIEATVLSKALSIVVYSKIAELSKACEENIVSGFVSSALGSEHSYHSDRDDQSNLNTLVSLAIDSPFTCCDTDLIVNPDKTYVFKNHTAAQLKEVLITGTTKKMNCLVAYRTLKAQANAATTDAAINAIVWTEI